MHHIQRYILHNLIRNEAVRYKDLKPANTDPNLFMYHLKQLQRDQLVMKISTGYALSSQGKLVADRALLEDLSTVTVQPRIVILLAVYDDAKGWLMHTRSVQPVLNMKGFVHANMELGSSAAESAQRRLKTLCGLEGTFAYRGSATITLYKETDLESYVHAMFFYCHNPSGTLISHTEVGTNTWEMQPDLHDPTMIPSSPDVFVLLKENELFYKELTFKL